MNMCGDVSYAIPVTKVMFHLISRYTKMKNSSERYNKFTYKELENNYHYLMFTKAHNSLIKDFYTVWNTKIFVKDTKI